MVLASRSLKEPTMTRLSLLAVIAALAGCAATPSQQTDVFLIGAEAAPCALRAIAAASKSDTVADALAVASVLATDPACTALAGPTVDLIRSQVAAGKTAAVAAP